MICALMSDLNRNEVTYVNGTIAGGNNRNRT